MLEIALPVLKRKKYAFVAAITTIVIFSVSYYLTVLNVAYKSIFIYVEMEGFWFTFTSLILTLAIAILFGIYTGLFVFRRDLIKKGMTGVVSGAGGIISSAFAAGCPSCGAPLLALFGAPTALLSLPFHGLEIKILSILLLFLSVYLLTESIEKKLKCAV